MDKKKYEDGGAVKRGNDMAKMRERERRMDMKAGAAAPTESLRPKMRPKTVDVSPSAEAPTKSLRPKMRPETVDLTPEAEAADQDLVKTYRGGGSVRGFKPGQVSGTNFSGTF